MRINGIIIIFYIFGLLSCTQFVSKGSVFYYIGGEKGGYSLYSFRKDNSYNLNDIYDIFDKSYRKLLSVYDPSKLQFLVLAENGVDTQLMIYDYINKKIVFSTNFPERYYGIDIIDHNSCVVYNKNEIAIYNFKNNIASTIYRLNRQGTIRKAFYHNNCIFLEVGYIMGRAEDSLAEGSSSLIAKYDLSNCKEELIEDHVSGLCMSKTRDELLFTDNETGSLRRYDLIDFSLTDLEVIPYRKNHQYCFIDDNQVLVGKRAKNIMNYFQLFDSEYRNIQLVNLKTGKTRVIDSTYSAGYVFNNPVYFEEDITDLLDDMEN